MVGWREDAHGTICVTTGWVKQVLLLLLLLLLLLNIALLLVLKLVGLRCSVAASGVGTHGPGCLAVALHDAI